MDNSFEMKIMVKSGAIEITYFQIPRALSEFQTYLLTGLAKRLVRPGQFKQVTLKDLVEFENNFNGTTVHNHFCIKTGVKCPEEFLCYSLAPETYSAPTGNKQQPFDGS